jgi:predicted enzyme related to lactoylglutathione lyase
MQMPSRFVYAQLQTSDFAGAKEFYRELCGWTMKDDPPGSPPYTEVMIDDEDIAGIMPSREPGASAQWLLYLSVDDVDAAARKAARLGATVIVPAMDIAAKGCRISVLTDPAGARFALRSPLASNAANNQP